MIIPATATAPPRQSTTARGRKDRASQRQGVSPMTPPAPAPAPPRQSTTARGGARPGRRPRGPVPIPVGPQAPATLAASILPAHLHDLLAALPPEARLPL